MSAECFTDSPVEIPAPMTYEQNLAHSQGIRHLIVNKLLAGGVPGDKEGVEVLLKVLKDKDQTALAERKNSIDADGLNSSKDVVDAMALLIKEQANRNPFMRRADGSVDSVDAIPAHHIPSVDPGKLGDYEPVAGETEIGIIQETAEDFMQRMAARAEEAEE